MSRIENKFRQLRQVGEKAFVAFITAGYPNLRVTEKLVLGLADSGVDIIELGVPFSDPIADGPVIQEASQEALKKGLRLVEVLKLVERLRRKRLDVPIALMTYYNPVFAFGINAFVSQAVRSGVDAVIIPDLPPEEGSDLLSLSRKQGLDVVLFVAPTTTDKRIKEIAGKSGGFIYYVSLTGVTGARKELAADLTQNLKKIKRYTSRPVCVGFGISNARQVKEAYRLCDGVIVGSAIVKKIKENLGSPQLVRRVCDFVLRLMP